MREQIKPANNGQTLKEGKKLIMSKRQKAVSETTVEVALTNKMDNKTRIEDINMELTTDVIDAANTLNVAYYKRHELLRKAGLVFGDTEEFSRHRYINGHRALIGLNYRTIREVCGISLEVMSDKCELSVEHLKELETCGFLSVWKGKYYHVSFEDSLIKDIYIGYLNLRLNKYFFEFSEIYFDDLFTINSAFFPDIKEEISMMESMEHPLIAQSYKNIQKAYEEIHEILARYLEI